jgi:hypothetical protein
MCKHCMVGLRSLDDARETAVLEGFICDESSNLDLTALPAMSPAAVNVFVDAARCNTSLCCLM